MRLSNMNARNLIVGKRVELLPPVSTACESGLEALEKFVDLAMRIQQQRLFILEFFQRRWETPSQVIPF